MNCSSSNKSFILSKKLPLKSQKNIRFNTLQTQSQTNTFKLIQSSQRISYKKRISTLNCLEPLNKKPRKYTEDNQQSPTVFSPKKTIIFNQYETKLKLSCESWTLYDIIKKQYKRGYKPNKSSSFNGQFRIIVLLCYCELLQKNEQIKKIKLIINPNNLKQKKLISEIKQKKVLKCLLQKKQTQKTFNKGSIVYLYDLIKAMIISGNQDLFQYCVLSCGYIISNIENQNQNQKQKIVIEQGKQNQYANSFCNFINRYLSAQLDGINQSKVINEDQQYKFISTPNQLTSIFLFSMQKYPVFKQVIHLQFITTYFKYQIGFNYWQDRKVTIKLNQNQRNTDHYCKLVYKGQKNYQAICINQKLNILMVIQDSKFSMGDLDFQGIQQWYLNVTKYKGLRIRSSSIISPTKNLKATLPLISITNN